MGDFTIENHCSFGQSIKVCSKFDSNPKDKTVIECIKHLELLQTLLLLKSTMQLDQQEGFAPTPPVPLGWSQHL